MGRRVEPPVGQRAGQRVRLVKLTVKLPVKLPVKLAVQEKAMKMQKMTRKLMAMKIRKEIMR